MLVRGKFLILPEPARGRLRGAARKEVTRPELASGHPANDLRRLRAFAGTLPASVIEYALRAWVRGSLSEPAHHADIKKHPNRMVEMFFMERATRLELATSTLARWRSTR